ncbi:unnamed protein product [Hermetia illucens]|nr:unnamed protein product [Hermetia illucens]
MDFKSLSGYIGALSNFDGTQVDLFPFIDAVDAVIHQVNNNPFKAILHQMLLGRIVGRAREVLHTHITESWSEVKALLINHFDTPENEIQLTERLLAARFTTAGQLYEYICKCLFKINHKIKYNVTFSAAQKSEMIKLKNQIAKNTFVNKCPEPIRGILHAYKPDSLESAYKVLVETGYVSYSGARNLNNSADQYGENRSDTKVRNLAPTGNTRFQSRTNLSPNSNVFVPLGNTKFQNGTDLSLTSDVSMNMATSRSSSLHVNTDFSATCLGGEPQLPITRLTIEGKELRCLIDTGCSTSILNSKAVAEHRQHRLSKPLQICSVNAVSSTFHGFYSEFPQEFQFKGRIEWKLLPFQSETFDCIIGQNILKPTKAIINFEDNTLSINSIALPITVQQEVVYMAQAANFEPENEKTLEVENHLTKEEQEVIDRIKKEFCDLEYDDTQKLSFTHDIKHELKLKILKNDEQIFGVIENCKNVNSLTICKSDEILDISNTSCIPNLMKSLTATCKTTSNAHIPTIEEIASGTILLNQFTGTIEAEQIAHKLNGTYLVKIHNTSLTVNGRTFVNRDITTMNVLPAILQPSPEVNTYQEVLSLQMMKNLYINNTSEIQLMRTETSIHQITTYSTLTIIGVFIAFIISFQLCLKFKTKNIVSEIKVKQSTELPSPVPTSSSSSKSDPEPPTSIPTSDPRSATTKVRFNDIRFF